MDGNTIYNAILGLLDWIRSNIVTIIISAGVPIILQLLQYRKISSESIKLQKEASKIESEADSIAVDSANKALTVWQTVVDNIKTQSEDCVKENARLKSQIELLESSFISIQKKQQLLVTTVQSIIKVFSEVKPDTVVISDSKGLVAFVSINIGELLGFDVKEFNGMNIYELFHPEDRAQNLALFNQLLLVPNMTMANRMRLRCRNGSYKWIELLGTNLTAHERVNGILISLRDISERKEIEKQFQQTLIENQ